MSIWSWLLKSSRNCFLIINSLPSIITLAQPWDSIASKLSLNKYVTCSGYDGAPIVTMALILSILAPANKEVAPPKEWPIMIVGARWYVSRYLAAAIISSTLLVKFVSSKSPSLSPNPVKSNLNTATPIRFRARLICLADFNFLLPVNTWTKIANGCGPLLSG